MKLQERQKLFENPTAAYRGKPFWSWNGRLEEKELLRQIDVMKQMGFGGYFMHSRTGLETEYLGEEWFELINRCADYGARAGMEAWLYDEDRWPSGSAGGIVTEEEKYRAMYLEMNFLDGAAWAGYAADANTAALFACRVSDGILSSKRAIVPGEAVGEEETVIEFRTRYSVCTDNYNGYSYVNTMNREAIDRYIEVTHEQYRRRCGDRLGKEIPGIFTDEPHRGGAFTNFAEGEENAVPYTPGLFDEFERRFGYSLRDNLPELFLRTRPGDLSPVKRDYFELCQQLFIECFARPVDEWCRANGMIFTGHVLHEDSLCCQTVMQGSLMRFYEYMEYPGMDLLGEGNRCYWVAKQLVSVARQLGKEWVLSELYGCTGWQMSFEAYKNVGDWQALLGVNLRSPHLSWYTMKGEAKRDYPASILHQSSWYGDYGCVETYFSRIHAALHDGEPVCGVLVINPIESVWARAYSGAFDGLFAKDPELVRLEERYAATFHALMGRQIDFDYGDEDILARHGRVESGALAVGRARYRKVLVCGADTLRKTTLELLTAFAEQGGEVVFAGDVPACLDARPSDAVAELAKRCVRVPFDGIADACATGMEVRIDSEGREQLFTQVCRVDGGRMVMLLNTDREHGYAGVTVNLGAGCALERWDPRSGRMTRPAYEVVNGEVVVRLDLERGGERLFMIPDAPRELPGEPAFEGTQAVALPDAFGYRLTERNICVLDAVSVRGGAELPTMEVLRADRALRDGLGLSWRGGEMLQPWYQIKYRGGDTRRLATVTLTYAFDADALPRGVALAVEDLEHIRSVRVNGRALSLTSAGSWIDICFAELAIPDDAFVLGRNCVEIEMDYYPTSGIEAVYLLGAFGVEVRGGGAALTRLPERLRIGDLTPQGLPFYSGSVVYEVEGLGKQRVSVCADSFGGALVKLHGSAETPLAFPPYRAIVDGLTAVEVVLTRRNTFGPLHQRPKRAGSYGPGNFTTTGDGWSDDYQLLEQGLLEKPEIRIQ